MSWEEHKRAVKRFERGRHLWGILLAMLLGALMGLVLLAAMKGWF